MFTLLFLLLLFLAFVGAFSLFSKHTSFSDLKDFFKGLFEKAKNLFKKN